MPLAAGRDMCRTVCIGVGVVAAFASCKREPSSDGSPGPVVIDSISLDSARAIADSVGVEALFQRVDHPSAVLTDFFGVQPLQPYTLDQILTDLVPELATVTKRGENRVTLRMNNGPTVVVQSNGRLFINGNKVEIPYARVVIEQPSTYPREPALFRAALVDAGLGERYLPRNPYYELEVQAVGSAGHTGAVQGEVSADTSRFDDHEHAIILVGETHGGSERYEQAMKLVALPSITWIAIEMIPENLQSSVDALQSHSPGSAPHRAARDSLLRFFSENWNTRGHEITATPEENPYFRLIVAAHRLGKRVIALDTRADYILFRFGEFPLGAKVRDATWAANIPSEGRGIVYGGSAHFSTSRSPNMLSFLQSRDSMVSVFQLRSTN